MGMVFGPRDKALQQPALASGRGPAIFALAGRCGYQALQHKHFRNTAGQALFGEEGSMKSLFRGAFLRGVSSLTLAASLAACTTPNPQPLDRPGDLPPGFTAPMDK